MLLRKLLVVTPVLSALFLSACHSGPSGTYSDPNGAVLLELKSGSKANFTFMGQVANCTYSSSGQQLNLSCGGDAGDVAFTIHDDGSLTGPPGSFMPMLRKEK